MVQKIRDAQGKNEYVFDEPINEDITLYAKWQEKAEASETLYPSSYSQTINVININETIDVGNPPLNFDERLYEFIPLMSGTITFKLSNYELHPMGDGYFLVILDSNKQQLLKEQFTNVDHAEVSYDVVKGEEYFLVAKRVVSNNYARHVRFELVGDVPTITTNTRHSGDVVELGQTVNIVAQDKAGYEFVGWYSDSTYETLVTTDRYYSFVMPESSVTYYAKYSPKEVEYTVYYHLENADDEEYSDGGSDVFSGIASTNTTAVAKAFANFTPEEIEQQIIHGDGSTEVHIYYQRNEFSFTISINDELAGTNNGTVDGNYKFGSHLTIKGKANAGYTFTGVIYDEETYEGTYTLEMPAEATTVTLVFTPNTNTKYKLIYHREALNGGYLYNTEEETLYGTTNSVIVVNKTYYGFTLVPIEETRIKGDGSTVLDVYFNRNYYTVTVVLADKEHSRLESEGFTYNEETEEYTKSVKYQADVELKLDANRGYDYDCWFIGDEKYSSYWRTYYEVTGDVTFTARISPCTECPYSVQFYIQNNINDYLNDPNVGRTWTYSTYISRWTGVTDQMTQETEESLQNDIPEGFEVFEINNVIYDYEADNVYVKVYCTPKLLKLTVSRNNYYYNEIQFNGTTILTDGGTETSVDVDVYHGQSYTLKIIFNEEEYYDDTMRFDGWYEPEDDYRIYGSGVLENTFTAYSNDDFELRAEFEVPYTVKYNYIEGSITEPLCTQTGWGRSGHQATFEKEEEYKETYQDNEHIRYYWSAIYYEDGHIVQNSIIGMKNVRIDYNIQGYYS